MIRVYADGGLLGPNPNPIGGMWAWVHVGEDDIKGLAQDSGLLICAPKLALLPKLATLVWPEAVLSSNQAEFVAAVRGLEALAAGEDAELRTDSLLTVRRLSGETRLAYLPDEWIRRGGRAIRRLGSLRVVHLKGHPTIAQLKAGRAYAPTLGGYLPVSIHNVRCDSLCRQQRDRYRLLTASRRHTKERV